MYLDSIEYARHDSNSSWNDFYISNWGSRLSPNTFTIAQNQYLHGLAVYFDSCNSYSTIDYNLNGSYKTLSGKIGIDDSTKNSTANGRIIVIGDGTEIYSSDLFKGGDLPRDVNIDISGVLRLQIKFEVTGDDHPNVVFGDAKLIQ